MKGARWLVWGGNLIHVAGHAIIVCFCVDDGWRSEDTRIIFGFALTARTDTESKPFLRNMLIILPRVG